MRPSSLSYTLQPFLNFSSNPALHTNIVDSIPLWGPSASQAREKGALAMADENPFARLFKQPGTSIVLAALESGVAAEPVIIQICNVDPATINYTCISYDRASESHLITIEVDAEATTIPEPLESALRALRRTDERRYVFADLLVGRSPEQRSTRAKETTVVFEHADEAIAWLGPGDGQTAAAFDIMLTLANEWQQATLRTGFPESISRATQQQAADQQSYFLAKPDADFQLSDAALYNAVRHLFASSYFQSIEITPEILLAKEVTIMSGSSQISWSRFNAALKAYTMLGPRLNLSDEQKQQFSQAFEQISSLDLANRRKAQGESLELLPMMQSAREGAFHDPREIVFSMLPIVTPSKRKVSDNHRPQPLTSDYSRSVQEVFKEAARYIIYDRQDLLLWWAERPPCGRKIHGLPSWVPDWTSTLPKLAVKASPNNGLRGWADPLQGKLIRVDDDFALHVHAHALDRVTSVSEVFTESNCRRLCLQAWQSLPNLLNETPQGKAERMFRTFVLDHAGMGQILRDNAKPPREMWVSFQSLVAEERILQLLKCTREEFMTRPELVERAKNDYDCELMGPLTGRSEPFDELLRKNALGRRIFQTEKGRTGMTAVEERPPTLPSDSLPDTPSQMVPNFDTVMGDPMAQAMLQHFQNHMNERDPQQAAILAKALNGTLPGQAPPGVRNGDLVVALVGGFQPYIVRPCSAQGVTSQDRDTETAPDLLESDATYTYVGDCYLHGVMEGECFKARGWFGTQHYRQDVGTVEITIV